MAYRTTTAATATTAAAAAAATAAYVQLSPTVVRLPPLIDCHVHLREPGLEHKADMLSESIAAYHGGISVLCDMPNTCPPTQTIAALADKVARATAAAAALRKTHLTRCDDGNDDDDDADNSDGDLVRIFFFFGATAMAHVHALEQLWTDAVHASLKARCCGLKLYLDNSTGDLKATHGVVEVAFALCGRLRIPLVAHCEQTQMNDAAAAAHPYVCARDGGGAAVHSLRRPPASEVAAVQEAIALARRHRTPLHIAHLSTAGALDAVRQARCAEPTLQLTCEVAPHHLFLTTDDYYYTCACQHESHDGAACPTAPPPPHARARHCVGGNARVKVNPPVRPLQHRDALWEGVLDGTVDCIATDHAPHTWHEKHDEAAQPPSGIPGVEVVVSLLLTVVAGYWPHPHTPCPPALAACAMPPQHEQPQPHDGADRDNVHGHAAAGRDVHTSAAATAPSRLTLDRVVELLHRNPNRIFALQQTAQPTRRFDTAARWTVHGAALHSKCGWTPYEGWQLVGKAL